MKSLTTVIEVLESCKNDAIECFECPMRHETECEVKSVALEYLKEYQSAKDDLDEKRLKYMKYMTELEDNPPLTWEQLKQMEGKPIWIELLNHDMWDDPSHRVDSDWWVIGEVRKDDIILATYLDEMELCEEDIGVSWQAYRKEREFE